MTAEANLGGLLLLIDVMDQQGRAVAIIDRSWWRASLARNGAADLKDVDYIVVEDATWEAWQAWLADRIEDHPLVCVLCGAPGGTLCEEHR